MQVSSGSRYWPAHIAAAAITARLQVRSVIKKYPVKPVLTRALIFQAAKNFPANSSGINNIMRRAFSVHRLKAESEKQKRGNGLSGRFGMARGCRLSGRAALMPGGQAR